MCEAFEKLIRNHISNSVGDDINCNQYGFVSGKSTLSNISESIDIINEYLMERDDVNIIYLNVSEALDAVSHNCLRVQIKRKA